MENNNNKPSYKLTPITWLCTPALPPGVNTAAWFYLSANLSNVWL